MPRKADSEWALAPSLNQDSPGIFSAGLDLREMCGRNPAHYAEYWKAVQELWLRLYLSNLVLVSAINVSVSIGLADFLEAGGWRGV